MHRSYCMSQHASLFHAARGRHSARGGLAGHLLRQATKLHMQLLLLLFITTCSWLALVTHTQPAHASTALSDRLQNLQASYKGHVESTYGVAGGYWVLDTNYSSPSVPLLSKTRYRVTNRTCWEIASSHPETMSQLYRPTRQPPTVSKHLLNNPHCVGKGHVWPGCDQALHQASLRMLQ